MKTLFFFFTIGFVLVIGSGCSSRDDATPVSADTPVPAVTPKPTKTATTVSDSIPSLPRALYFLEGSQVDSQVWRLGTDGTSKVQITHAKNGVDVFAVSPIDGRIAFVNDNQLFLMNNDGENLSLIADGHAMDENVEDYAFRSRVSSPVFSPDNRILAYGFNGLHLYDLATDEDSHILTNLGNLLGEPFVFSKEAYSPGPWSPDGSLLLITMSYYEGSTLAVMDLDAEQPFRRLWSDGPVCCVFEWSADGNSVLVANPYYTGDIPGLWSFDAETGEESVVVPGLEEDGSINHVGWPMKLDSGDLFFFHANLERFSPDVGIPLTMVRSDADGSHQKQVRPETFRVIDVLWIEDGSAALILQPSDNGNVQAILARTDGGPLEILFEGPRVRSLMWGP